MINDFDLGENGILFNNNTIHADVPFENYSILDELVEATQVGGPWLENHPLPLPTWGPEPKKPLQLSNLREYEELATQIELQVQQLLEKHNYNTVANFLGLYRGFKNSGCYNLKDYFHRYA